MMDLHTHILPCFDDGSSSSAESIEMLCELWKMGIRDVVLTPHFYARRDEPGRFLQSRSDTVGHFLKRIEEYISESNGEASIPNLYLGAEVAYFGAMSNVDIMKELCISGTDHILVEMPFEHWSMAMVNELYVMKRSLGITPIIAHIDRYFSHFKNEVLDEMIANGIKLQINADGFTKLFTKKRSLELLREGKIDYIGSDCHNMTSRAPNISSAVAEIEKKLGAGGLLPVYKSSEELLQSARPIYRTGD